MIPRRANSPCGHAPGRYRRPMLPRRFVVLCLASVLPVLLPAAVEPAPEPPPPWAYGFKTPPPPGTAQVPPGKAGPPSPDPVKYGLPGTTLRFTRAEIQDIFGPADYFPDGHPPAPAIVSHG